MADSPGPLRIARPPERWTARKPGPAVVLILLYAALFAVALWSLRARSPLFQRRRAPVPPAAGSKREVVPRAALLAAEGLAPAARDEYFRGLSTQCCTCGCEASVRDCLLSDQSCGTSPEMAQEILEQLR